MTPDMTKFGIYTVFQCHHCKEKFSLISDCFLLAGQCPRCEKSIRPKAWAFEPPAMLTFDMAHRFKLLLEQAPQIWQFKDGALFAEPAPDIPREFQNFRPPAPSDQPKKNTRFLRRRTKNGK